MHAVIRDGTSLSTVDDVELRAVDATELVVEIDAAGLCHSDLKPLTGSYPLQVPAVLGHEAVGRVIDAGTDARGLLGRRVVLSPVASCGRCPRCRRGSPTTCETPPPPRRPPFRRGTQEVNQFVRLGAFARRTIVDAHQVIPIPDTIPDQAAALLGCAAVTGVGAVLHRARVQPDETVVVVGVGGIGLNVVQGARIAGAGEIIAIDSNASKEQIARKVGATHFVTAEPGIDITTQLAEVAPDGIDAAFDCVGRTAIVESLADSLRPGGRLVIIGLPVGFETAALAPRSFFADKSLLGCRMGSVDPHTMIPELANRYLDGSLLLDELVTKVVPLEDITSLIADLEAGRLDRGVMSLRHLNAV